MADSVACAPATITDDGSATIAWSNPTNARVTDAVYAVAASVTNVSPSDNLLSVGFNVPVPSGASIQGITFTIVAKATVAGRITLTGQLTKNGSTATGSTRSVGTLTTSDATYTLGTATDLWGLALRADEVGGANFGVFIQAGNNGAAADVSIDSIAMVVSYTPTGRKQRAGRPLRVIRC